MKEQEIIDILEDIAGGSNEEELKKLGKELNPENNSTFEKELDYIRDNVDISAGVEKLLKYTEKGKYEDAGPAYTQSGIEYIKKRIIHYLIDSGIANNVLVEYSLLSSTLNPNNPDKLQCCSFLIGESGFKEKVGRYYTLCIDYTAEVEKGKELSKGMSIYQHPNFLFNIMVGSPSNEKVFSDDGTETTKIYNGQGLSITIKKDIELNSTTLSEYKDYSINEKRESSFRPYKFNEDDTPDDSILIEAFTLERRFKDMLSDAKNNEFNYSLLEVQNTLHSFCHKNITKQENGNRTSVYVSFPIHGTRASNQLPQYKLFSKEKETALQGIGACFIYFEPKDHNGIDDDRYTTLLKEIIEKIHYEVSKFIRFASANYMFNLGLQLQENARREAMKSAKAAIMSRNMSHNLGSHVMSYLKQNLSSVQSMLNDRILALLFENEQDMLNKLEIEFRKKLLPDKKDSLSEKAALPFLVGLGQFISYIQERQDFIATIATDFIPYLSNINFKDFVYDELNPDKRYERHKDRKNLEIDNILLGNIARSEGLGRETSPTRKKDNSLNDIVLKFRSFDGDAVMDKDGNILQNKEEAYNDLKEMRDYEFSLPGGVVGRQAIFSIVENVIRNAAKHGNWREKKKLELTFDIYKKDDFVYNENGEIIGINNRSFSILNDNNNHLSLKEIFENIYLRAKDSNDLFFITLTDNLAFDDTKLGKLRKSIIEPLVDDKGIMNEAGKGIKEMRISASWLRGVTEAEVYNPIPIEKDADVINDREFANNKNKKNAPILYARISNGHLQYIFCILRPKKVAIVSSRFKNKDIEYNKKAFLRFSWGAFTPVQYNYLNNKSYEFIIYDDRPKSDDTLINLDSNKENYDSYDYLRRISSSRLLKLSEIDELKDRLFDDISQTFDNLEDENVIYKSIEAILYKHISAYKENEDFIVIDDKKTDSRKINEGLDPFKAIKIVDGLTSKQPQEENWYIYRTHHDSTKEFGEYMGNNKVKKGSFVEGITGNNSTDRLTRNDNLDKEWFYRHLHAMKETIGVFDERIFTKIFGLEESDLKITLSTENQEIDLTPHINQYFDEHNITELKEQMEFMNKEDLVQILDSQYHFLGASLIKSIDEKDAKTNYTPTSNTQKGIFVFTIIQDPEKDKSSVFNLYGIKRVDTSINQLNTVAIDELHVTNGRYCSKCAKLATIEWVNESLSINWLNDSEKYFANKFNHISIHQGLLDKLYEVFGIKDNAEMKEILTRDFYKKFKKFSQKNDDIIVYDNNKKFFLPGMCIHSGRSKPSTIDMPQELPFIQYASIEHAILDCKYSLVELLDFARYE